MLAETDSHIRLPGVWNFSRAQHQPAANRQSPSLTSLSPKSAAAVSATVARGRGFSIAKVKCFPCLQIMNLNTPANLRMTTPVSPVERLRFPLLWKRESLGSKFVVLRARATGKSTSSRLRLAARYVLLRLGCPCNSTGSLVKSLATS
jgi:hypothetical protein